MVLACTIIYFIILTAGNTLYAGGMRNIESAEQMADALKPFAGESAQLIFSIGFIGSAIFCIPALAVSAAFSIAESKNWRHASLEKKPGEAPKFYAAMILSIFFGIILNVAGVNPVDMLFVSAVINGIIIPILFLMNHVTTKHLKLDRTGFKILLSFSWIIFSAIILFILYFIYRLVL